MKNSSDTIGNRYRDLPAGSAVPQPIAPPRTQFWRILNRTMQCIMKHANWGRKTLAQTKSDFRVSLELLTVAKYGVERETDKHLKRAQEENDWRLVDDNGTGNDNRRRKFPRGLN